MGVHTVAQCLRCIRMRQGCTLIAPSPKEVEWRREKQGQTVLIDLNPLILLQHSPLLPQFSYTNFFFLQPSQLCKDKKYLDFRALIGRYTRYGRAQTCTLTPQTHGHRYSRRYTGFSGVLHVKAVVWKDESREPLWSRVVEPRHNKLQHRAQGAIR